MGNLEGQAVLITGGGSGLGRGLADSFLEAGASVGILENSEEKVDRLRSELSPKSAVVIHGDVRSPADNEAAVAETVAAFGTLDSFVQCAAITDWSFAFSMLPAGDIPAAFDEVMRVNVLGAVLGAKAAIPELRKTSGSIVFTLSTSGFFPGGQGALYTLSKHAMTGLVRQLAYELAPTIRVNAAVPGPVKESRLAGPAALGQQALYPELVMPELERLVSETAPLPRYPSAQDYGPLYLLLADREAGKLATGSIVFWDGGISLVGHGTEVMKLVQAQS